MIPAKLKRKSIVRFPYFEYIKTLSYFCREFLYVKEYTIIKVLKQKKLRSQNKFHLYQLYIRGILRLCDNVK